MKTGSRRFIYPAVIEKGEDGFYLVTFPDVPEALTDGESYSEALSNAQDALDEAIAGYIDDKQPIPVPSVIGKGQIGIAVPTLTVAKLVLGQTMKAQHISNVDLAKAMATQENAVRRLRDLNQKTKIETVEKALAFMGQRVRLIIEPIEEIEEDDDEVVIVENNDNHASA